MKKKLALVLGLAMIMTSLTGCLNNAKPAETAAPAAEATAAATEAAAPAVAAEDMTYQFDANNIGEHKFRLSTTAQPGSALYDVAHHMADTVGTLSDGKMTVEVYDGSSIGSESENLQALTAGTLDMAIVAVEFYVNSIPQLGALILPYVYEDYDQVQKVLESEAGQYANEQLRNVAQVENLGYYVMAFRNMYTTKPLNTVDDLAGLKMRVPDSTLYVDTFKMMGAAPTPLASSEVYTALDTGVVEGFENTADSCLHMSIFEVAKYFNQTNHLNAPTTFSMSAKVFDQLNDDEKALLKEAGIETSRYGLESTKTSDQSFRDELKEKGMEFIDTDVASMRDKIDYNSYEFMQSDEAKKLFELVNANK